ncbi:MAG: type VI secretion system baseplate subunit TssE [Phycisphaerae bacterium]|nr:type VI secretion system baseplate subunit TssE [Phycisphaerae bacterium]NIP55732.1 type VI secretion system baseplate subunit TssE [Phycisphaerae bacterium]NIS49912.1 type VI secretion system baseplate subunit TssE [Phycisphaerae bacterium]NIU07595.1 type VI secretion system baseplate subunit TssE [Phycisphaerae bacterium]NIU55205.1 type VI secretion system baseplate subunit TssE [Phycisphaerae bacterium]
MAEIAPMERLQPCLLDRLTDDEPDVSREGRDQHVVSLRKYRKAVLRDVEMLFNSRAYPLHDMIYDFGEVARSVLNYGILDLSGANISEENASELEAQMKQALRNYEPRISHKALSIHVVSSKDAHDVRSLLFEISGELWAHPLPDHLFIKTEVDLETGHCKWKGEPGG